MQDKYSWLSKFSWKSVKESSELQKRLFFTLGILFIYRICTFVQIPGLSVEVISEYVSKSGGGFLAMFDSFAGGAVGRSAVMAFGLSPYITASIIMQLLSATSPALKALSKEGEAGQRKKNQYVRYIALLMTIVYSYSAAMALESFVSANGVPAVLNPGWLFRFSTVVSIVGGTFLLIWLAEQITSRGLGQGSSMIIYAGILANMPATIAKIKLLYSTGEISGGLLSFDIGMLVALLLFVVFVERSYRKVPVQYPKGQMHMLGGVKLPDEMPIKLNVVGVMAPIFANTIMSIPMMIAYLVPWISRLGQYFSGQLIHSVIYGVLLVFFVFQFSPITIDPDETAESLRKNGSFIPGYRPGAATAKFFRDLLFRLSFIGSGYLLIVCVLPEIFIRKGGLNVFFGGTSLLIIVGVTYELISQIYGYILSVQYENIFSNANRKYSRFK